MFSLIVYYAWLVAQVLIGCSLVLPAVLYLLYSASKLVKKQPPLNEELAEEKDYAIIVSVNRQMRSLQPVINSLLQLNYTNYLIYVVVNNNGVTGIPYNNDKVIVLHPAEEISNNLRIHRYAIEHFKRPHTHLTILDSHSLADSEYLNELNGFFNQGYQAVQSMYINKKTEDVYGAVHAAGNMYNRFFTGDVSFALGSSATLAGSGMAFTISLYEQCLKQISTKGSCFAKAMQHRIVSKGHQIAFAPNAIVYDRKETDARQLIKLHARGMNLWFRQLGNNIYLLGKSFHSFTINRFLFSLLLLQLPLFTSLLSAVFCMVMNVWLNPSVAVTWLICLTVFSTSVLDAFMHVKANHYDTNSALDAEHSLFSRIKSLYKETKGDVRSAYVNK